MAIKKHIKRPPCVAPDCEKEARGWQGGSIYCNAHRLLSQRHGRLDTVKQPNVGLTCSVEWCDKVCKSGADKFAKGMCASCHSRLQRTGTTELSHLMLKRKGIWRTCSVDGCEKNEQGESTYCHAHWNKLVYLPKGGQAVHNYNTRLYRARRYKAESDEHTIPELHQYWRTKGIDPKRCTYCDAWHTKWGHGWKWSQGDHVVPLNKGGTDTMGNIVPCCRSCNASKADRILYEQWIPHNQQVKV